MHDVAIVGAGPVGATLALALAGNDLDVVAIDGRPPGVTLRQDRSLALSWGSRLTLERLGVWTELESVAGAVTPIVEIDVSQAGGFGAATLTAAMQSLPALGYVVSYVALQRALDAALARADVPVRFGTIASRVHGTPAHAEVIVADEGEPLRARLAVVADGTGTAVDGIVRERHDYGQVALVGEVFLDPPRRGVAYERFTPDGPVALLPERDHHGLVWTMTPEIAEAMLALPERAFLDGLARHFGTRVTGFAHAVGRRAFPLVLERARPVVTARAAVIGNAAQQLHPVAGQGFNLGLARCLGTRAGDPRRAPRGDRRRHDARGLRGAATARPRRGHRVHARTGAHLRQRRAACTMVARVRAGAARRRAAGEARVHARDAPRHALIVPGTGTRALTSRPRRARSCMRSRR